MGVKLKADEFNKSTGELKLRGLDSVANYIKVLAKVTYENVSNTPNTDDDRIIEFVVNDGQKDSAVATTNLTVVDANDDPTVTGLPSDIKVTEDGPGDVDLSASAFADVDAASKPITVTLTATAGTLTSKSTSSVTVGGTGTGTLSLSGMVADINTFLDTASNVKYEGLEDAAGDDVATLAVTANDNGNSGVGGGGIIKLGSVNIDIDAVNDAPKVTNLDGDDLTFTTGAAAAVIDKGGDAAVADVDSADFNGGNLTVTITSGGVATEDELSFDISRMVSLAGTTAGSNVSVGANVVGTLANKIEVGKDLVVNFNSANATPAAVQTLIQAISYKNGNTTNPSTTARTVQVAVDDGDGGTSVKAGVTVKVN